MEENYKIVQWFNDDLKSDALKELEAHPDFEFYEKIKQYSSELQTKDFEDSIMLHQILKSKKQAKTIPIYNNWLVRVVAILLIALTVTYSIGIFQPTSQIAEKTKTVHFLLPDASEVVLNADSKATYKNFLWDSNRNINLEGEAFFKVAKGKKFEVHTNLGNVTVLGTHFNVKARDNRLDVVCYEGRVKVTYKNSEVIITKNESVAFENGNPIEVAKANGAQPDWLHQQLAFSKATLDAITKELERQYAVEITLTPNLSNQLFTGKIPANDWESAMQIISATYHVHAIKKSDTHFILKPMHATN